MLFLFYTPVLNSFLLVLSFVYTFLFFVTLSESIVCATASLQYSFEIVVASIILTIAATLGIIIYTLRSKRDLSSCGMALTAFVAQLFFFGFINLFIRSRFLDMLYCLAATALVGMYLVYDVQLISGKFGKEYEIDDDYNFNVVFNSIDNHKSNDS